MNLNFSSLVNPSYNSENLATNRFSAAQWFDFVKNTEIAVAGVGGIGSWTAFMLARLNPGRITLIDPDKVETSNMAGQLYDTFSVGNFKVNAIANIIHNFANYYRINALNISIDSETPLPPIIICGFDNMRARRITYQSWKSTVYRRPEREHEKSLLIDGRLSAETLQVFCIPGNAPYYMEEYESTWLFSDSEAENTVCSYKQTSYCANLIASIITNLFVNWCTNQCDPLVDRSLPFMTEYSAEQMFFKTEV